MSRRFIQAKGGNENFEVRLNTDYRTGGMSMDLIKWDMLAKKMYMAKAGRIEWTEVQEGERLPDEPFLAFDNFLQQEEFLLAMAEALDDAKIKTEKDAKLQGTLDALRDHLADLRHLLKLPPKP